VIEVSDTTRAKDRGRKKEAYGWSGIPVYWIVNLVDGQVEVYTPPGVHHFVEGVASGLRTGNVGPVLRYQDAESECGHSASIWGGTRRIQRRPISRNCLEEDGYSDRPDALCLAHHLSLLPVKYRVWVMLPALGTYHTM
jgi:hypothetical protein